IHLEGTEFQLKLATNSGLSKSGSGLTVASSIAGDGLDFASGVLDVDAGSGLEIHSDGSVRIATSAAGDGLTGGGGSALEVDAGSGLEIHSDGSVRIASTAAGDGLTGGGGSALSVST